MTDPNANAMLVAAYVQASCAVATVVVTVLLAVITGRYARDSKRMADVMAKDFELRIAPLVDIERGGTHAVQSVTGWNAASLPMKVRNLGSHPAVISSAELEFRAVHDDCPIHRVPAQWAVGTVEPGSPREFVADFPLSRVDVRHQVGPNAGGRVLFRIRYRVRGVTGVEVESCSPEFRL